MIKEKLIFYKNLNSQIFHLDNFKNRKERILKNIKILIKEIKIFKVNMKGMELGINL